MKISGTYYLSEHDTDGMALKFERWINKNHPDVIVRHDNGISTSILVDDNGDIIKEYFWEDFCNDTVE